MNRAQLLDIVYEVESHLRLQGGPAEYAGQCRYRAPQEKGYPLMCAVGCLIPDEEYKPEMETKTAVSLLINHKVPSIEDIPVELLTDMQAAHDSFVRVNRQWRTGSPPIWAEHITKRFQSIKNYIEMGVYKTT